VWECHVWGGCSFLCVWGVVWVGPPQFWGLVGVLGLCLCVLYQVVVGVWGWVLVVEVVVVAGC